MRIPKSLTACVSLAVLLAALPAAAQTAQGPAGQAPGGRRQTPVAAPVAPPVKTPRIFLDGVGGITFQHVAGGLVAGGVTITAAKHVQVTAEVGRMSNVLPSRIAGNLNATAASLVASGTPSLTYHASIPSVYGLAGLRVSQTPSKSGLALYVEAGGGFAHVTSRLSALSAGADYTGTFLSAAAPLPTSTRPLLQAGTGISITVKKTSAVDLGYRYGRIFTTSNAIATSRFYAALRVGI